MPSLDQPGILPGMEVHAFARRRGEHVEWPLGEDTVIANALFHVNSHSVNRVAGRLSFDGIPVFVDHVMFSGMELNAFASRYRDRYITALYGALYLNCLDTAFTLLSTRGSLPEIGKHLEERPLSDRYVVGTASERFVSSKAYFEYLAENMPRCPVRRDAAHALAAIMLAFVFQHEEGHIMLGHTDYSIYVRKRDRLSEAGAWMESDAEQRSIHFLSELDADQWAWLNLLLPLSIKSLSKNYSTLVLPERQWIWLSWLGAALTGALLAVIDRHTITDPVSWESHPHGILRARETMLPSRARWLAEENPAHQYMDAFADAWESLSNLAEIWPQYRLFRYAFRLDGEAEQAIIAFNATIKDDHKRTYQAMRKQFEVRHQSP